MTNHKFKTKNGLDVEVVGSINVDNTNHVIVKLPNPQYYLSTELFRYIVIPASNLINPNIEWVEEVPIPKEAEVEDGGKD